MGRRRRPHKLPANQSFRGPSRNPAPWNDDGIESLVERFHETNHMRGIAYKLGVSSFRDGPKGPGPESITTG